MIRGFRLFRLGSVPEGTLNVSKQTYGETHEQVEGNLALQGFHYPRDDDPAATDQCEPERCVSRHETPSLGIGRPT